MDIWHYTPGKLTLSLPLTLLLLVSSLLLTSCGNSASSWDNMQSPTTDNRTKTSQISSGNVSTTPNQKISTTEDYEVINGITVPPEPSPEVNNATLAGVDINGNGVRDDIERFIALTIKDRKDFEIIMPLARNINKLATASTTLAKEEIDEIYKTNGCIGLKFYRKQKVNIDKVITEMTINTKLRRSAMILATANFFGRMGSNDECN